MGKSDKSLKKLYHEYFHDLYLSPNVIQVTKSRRMSWTGQMVHMGEVRGACRVLVGRFEGNRQLGRLKHIWEGNITIILQETEWNGMHGVHLSQNKDKWWALVNMAINFWVP